MELLMRHLAPFSIVIGVWLVVYLSAGLYEKHTLLFKSKLPRIIFNAQVINCALAVLFFYLIPFFEIAPKTNLFIYLVVSFALILLWRNVAVKMFGFRSPPNGLLIGTGQEMDDLFKEVNNNPRYNLHFVSVIDLSNHESPDVHQKILNTIYENDISLVVIDLKDERVQPIVSHLYNLVYARVQFLNLHEVYEEIFDRIPLSLIDYSWFLELSFYPHATYDILKRSMDVVVSFVLGSLSLLLYPFVALAIKLEDGGPIFYVQKRLGQNNRLIRVVKFRSMTSTDTGDEALDSSGKVTKVGAFLRSSRIDELPQLWNVLKGDLSLIGPRPEIPELAEVYEEEVPYYNIRHLIKPGLSGWAQICQENPAHHGAETLGTKEKLSYDLYYIKNRSIFLDIKIALRTLAIIIARAGE